MQKTNKNGKFVISAMTTELIQNIVINKQVFEVSFYAVW